MNPNNAASALTAWRCGKSAGVADDYYRKYRSAIGAIDLTREVDRNTLAIALHFSIGIIEELERMARLLPSEQQTTQEPPIDPRRLLRTPVKPADLPKITADIDSLYDLCTKRADSVAAMLRRSAQASGEPFALARLVFACRCHERPPGEIYSLAAQLRFPENLAKELHAAHGSGVDNPNLQRAVDAFDAYAEANLA